jgi:hypothetical protein
MMGGIVLFNKLIRTNTIANETKPNKSIQPVNNPAYFFGGGSDCNLHMNAPVQWCVSTINCNRGVRL